MNYIGLPIKSFLLCSTDEDVEVLETPHFDIALEKLNQIRSAQPDKTWELVATIDA